jgi:hypothetical protein
VYESFPDLLAEMMAYSMAAAHQELPHLRMDHFMVSNVDVVTGEGGSGGVSMPDNTHDALHASRINSATTCL